MCVPDLKIFLVLCNAVDQRLLVGHNVALPRGHRLCTKKKEEEGRERKFSNYVKKKKEKKKNNNKKKIASCYELTP